MDWDKLTNAEIEMKLKTMEMEYNNVKKDITQKFSELTKLNTIYIEGKNKLIKRTSGK